MLEYLSPQHILTGSSGVRNYLAHYLLLPLKHWSTQLPVTEDDVCNVSHWLVTSLACAPKDGGKFSNTVPPIANLLKEMDCNSFCATIRCHDSWQMMMHVLTIFHHLFLFFFSILLNANLVIHYMVKSMWASLNCR